MGEDFGEERAGREKRFRFVWGWLRGWDWVIAWVMVVDVDEAPTAGRLEDCELGEETGEAAGRAKRFLRGSGGTLGVEGSLCWFSHGL